MGKTSFQSIHQLIQTIESKLKRLQAGQLSVAEIDQLVKDSADLHERLAVIRHKAFEVYGEPVLSPTQSIQTEPAPTFDFTSITVSESTAKSLDETLAEKESEQVEKIDFSSPIFTPDIQPEEKKVIPVVAEPEVKKPIHLIREEIKQESQPLHEKFLKDEVPLNEKLKAEEEVPLRKKLGLTPIKDLRAEIGIGKKFEYINFLFAGDAKAYETAINELNSCPDAETARQKLNVYASVYRWELEDKTIVKFVELVERRFL
jgi:hypothetical protein